MGFISNIQRLGQALMMPIAILPIAGLLLRLGGDDMIGGLIGTSFIQQAGDAIFTNLPILFAIGVAMAWAKDNNGAAALAGAVGYYIMNATALGFATFLLKGNVADLISLHAENTELLKELLTGLGVVISSEEFFANLQNTDVAMSFLALPTDAKALQVEMSVLGGIVMGLLAGGIYNKYYNIKLPEYLAFFGGRRFVPIVTGLVALVVGVAVALLWPPVGKAIDTAGHYIIEAGSFGKFIYGFLNRLLIMTGLHHIINSIVWFELGSFTTATGELVKGEIPRFLAGDPTAGSFTAGFYPVMMLGLPGAALAMYLNAKDSKKKIAGGILMSATFTAVLTGVTEPLEFAFMFLAPVLYIIHALLTGLTLVIVDMLGAKIAFSFSAGLIDFVLYYGKASNPFAIVMVGAALFVIYFVLFYFFIKIFNIKTIGREDDEEELASVATSSSSSENGLAYISALGGAENIITVGNCTTRLRLELQNPDLASEKALKQLGAKSLIKVSGKAVQVVVGPSVEFVADDIKQNLAK